MSTILSFAEMYPSKWLKAADIQGREVIVTIESIRQEEFDDDVKGKVMKNILIFTGADKELILNVTNGKTIFDAYGEPQNWIGKQVVLFVMTVQGPNGSGPGIRLRAHYGEAAVAAAPPATANEPAAIRVGGSTVHPDSTGDDDLPF